MKSVKIMAKAGAGMLVAGWPLCGSYICSCGWLQLSVSCQLSVAWPGHHLSINESEKPENTENGIENGCNTIMKMSKCSYRRKLKIAS
jgi:hypothetical protein